MKKIITFTLAYLVLGCSTMSFIPREGGAAKINLATVEYVQEQNQKQNEVIIEQISKNLEELLNQVLVDDRAKIAELEKLLNEQEQKLQSVTSSVDTVKSNILLVSVSLRKDLADVKASNDNTRLYLEAVKGDIEDLPKEALKEFNAAIEAYLNSSAE